MTEEKEYLGMSPLPLEEKKKILDEEYYPSIHKIGITTSLVHALIIFLPAICLATVFGVMPSWGKILEAFVVVASIVGPYWIIEPISYFLVLGVVGTYVSFLAGNISNMRLPISAVSQEVAGVREGSPEGEIVGGLGIIASQWMLTIFTLAAGIIVTAVVAILPAGVKAAFDWLLPCLWGAIFGQFGLRAPKYAVIALAIGIPLVWSKILPGWANIPAMVFGMAILTIVLYRRGIWVK